MDNASSAADFIQASRILKIASPLGEDQLLAERVTIEEGISSMFAIHLVARTKKAQIKPEELIGRLLDVSVEVQQGDGEAGSAIRRPFNGLVTELNEGPPITRGLRSYAMVLRPQMWLLTRRSDCRIWMDKSSVEIAEILFSEHGIPAPDTSGVITAPPKQHYSVQFNERDYDYLCRRFEEDGLFYWFSHEDGKHKLHVADTANGWLGPSASAQGEGRVRLAQGSSDRNHINEWARRFSYVPGQRAGADWNFETPRMVPGTMTPSLVQMPDATKRELYEYPARISSVAEAERAQKLRSQASEADHDRVFGASTSRIIETGRRFTPYEVAHPDHAYEEHVIIKSIQTVVDRSYETNSNEPEYRNEFEAVPSRVPMTPHRETKRPRIEGAQVAIVAGPEGEEIHPDQYGRIKVWFPWDRKAKKDGSDTCWVRVAQNWGGSTWGSQVIPRIGMEVMIAYVDGDPDRPLVTGVVPNPKQKVPYDLPAHKTKSVLRTNTHKSGMPTQFNELSFEDAAGAENVFLHAQKDLTQKVLNNQTSRIDANHVMSVGAHAASEVSGNQAQQIGGSSSTTIGAVGGAANAGLQMAMSGQSVQTQALLGQAMQLAMSALQAAGNKGSPVDTSALTGGGGELSQLANLAGQIIGSGAVGGLLGAVIDGSRGGINNASASSMVSGGGAGMASAGSELAGMASQILGGLGGVMSTTVSRFQHNATGLGSTEQVGVSKVVNVGQTAIENVGKAKRVVVGEELLIEVGKSSLLMKNDGTIVLKGLNIFVEGAEHVQVTGDIVDNN
ncbi:type VI secretion system tip protein VgrG [Rhizobiales bacterium RZME27]|uniref:Type VI secretion system tip protein VgrG n=1 Tax=Endobacterium cereale TaxID=2663029 RepID=A0A6A8AE62_9HYPH|nr:type VI secretion system tip protein TssI/VgrG [Endobacterium cereale]MQY49605.1 type VI secretion system tip protein VgrG [Endobacterium cereale]